MSEFALSQGRYMLFLDILGFSELVKKSEHTSIFKKIDAILKDFVFREGLIGEDFKTIYFSDTFIFYQNWEGYSDHGFLDIYAIASELLIDLLSKGIPARGCISFGELHINDLCGHQVYFGKALIEAYEGEQRENWIGITILPSAWIPYETNHPGTIQSFEDKSERIWLRRKNGVLFLNPFRVYKYAYLMEEIMKQEEEIDSLARLRLNDEIHAFSFLLRESEKFSLDGDFVSRTATKYHVTKVFLAHLWGKEIFDWFSKKASTITYNSF